MAYGSVIGLGVPQDRGVDDRDTSTKTEYIGALIEQDVKPGAAKMTETIKAKVGDLLQFRITSPQLGRAVLNLQVSVDGNARKVAVVRPFPTKREPSLNNKDVSVFVLPEKPGRATVRIAFVDNEGKPFHRIYPVELVER
jgi:hypothetical protein